MSFYCQQCDFKTPSLREASGHRRDTGHLIEDVAGGRISGAIGREAARIDLAAIDQDLKDRLGKTWFPWSGPSVICPVCSATVRDWQQHRDWHRSNGH